MICFCVKRLRDFLTHSQGCLIFFVERLPYFLVEVAYFFCGEVARFFWEVALFFVW